MTCERLETIASQCDFVQLLYKFLTSEERDLYSLDTGAQDNATYNVDFSPEEPPINRINFYRLLSALNNPPHVSPRRATHHDDFNQLKEKNDIDVVDKLNE